MQDELYFFGRIVPSEIQNQHQKHTLGVCGKSYERKTFAKHGFLGLKKEKHMNAESFRLV